MDLFCRAKYNSQTVALLYLSIECLRIQETEQPINFDEIRLDFISHIHRENNPLNLSLL